jgi:hypothetical protein
MPLDDYRRTIPAMIAVGLDRPEGGDGVLAPSSWIDELEE